QETARCKELLDAATRWIVHSGSVEHLCLMHLVQARCSLDGEDTESAQRAAAEGLHLARQCGLGLYLIPLLCVQSEICLARLDAPEAEHVAAAAWERALAADCQYLWGATEAGHQLGQTLLAQRVPERARPILERTLYLCQQIGDPRAEDVEQ